MQNLHDQFSAAVDALAALNHYPFTQRRTQWLQRLSVNVPDLTALLQADSRADIGYLQPPTVAPAPGGLAADTHQAGMALLAQQHQRDPAQIARTVQLAWQAAQDAKPLNAFIHLYDQAALTQAVAALPHKANPLLGVPIAVKDLMRVAGLAMTGGSGESLSATQTQDAAVVARLRQAGAVVIGTTNLHELAYGITSENPHHGWVGNPNYPGHMAGGSSGGSAAAVAAGIVPMAIGTDTGGSIRIPAACCGIVGFKPSFNATPRDGVMTLGASLDHVGPITANVADAALAFSIMAGLPAQVPDAPRHLRGVRIGIPSAWFFAPLAPEVSAAVERTLALLRKDGAEVVPVDIAHIARCSAIQFATLCSEATHVHWNRLCQQPDTLGEDVRVRLEIGQFLPARWYIHAQHLRANLVQAFAHAMQGVDVLATPTLRTLPPTSGQTQVHIDGTPHPTQAAMTGLTSPFNLTGMPAITLPCQAPGQLPVGLQLVGQHGADWHVLNLAARVEQLLTTSASIASSRY